MSTLSVAPDENPVVFTPSRALATREVTITWDTDLLSAGRVGRRVDGGAEEVFGAGRAGSAVTEIALNQTQTFTLRSGVGQVLATLVVTTVLETADLPCRPTSRIDVTRATVEADRIHLRWRTSRSVACWAEITGPGIAPGFAWTADGAVHQVSFDGLAPDTEYAVRILPEGGTNRYLGTVHTASESSEGTWTPDPEVFRQVRLRPVADARPADTAAEAVASHDGGAVSVAAAGTRLVEVVMSDEGRMRLRCRADDGTWCAWTELGTVLPPGSHAVHWESEGLLVVTVADADNLVRVLTWRDPPTRHGRGDWVTVGTLA